MATLDARDVRTVSMKDFLEHADRIRARHPLPGEAPSAAELIREDRER